LELERLESLHQLLVAGSQDPQQLLISGDELLSSQPSLQRLKDGLIDAQIESSRLVGVYTPKHPRRRAAILTEMEISERMLEEARAAMRAMQPTLSLARERVSRLRDKNSQLNGKLIRLADVRTSYSKLDAEVKALNSQLADAEGALNEAQASRSAALSTNLLAELGPPQVGDSPEGISGAFLTLGAGFAGLVFGLGTVFLVAPGPSGPTYGRRFSDYVRGRRSSDSQVPGQPTSAPATPPLGGVERRRQ